jgi:hypothetical protein
MLYKCCEFALCLIRLYHTKSCCLLFYNRLYLCSVQHRCAFKKLYVLAVFNKGFNQTKSLLIILSAGCNLMIIVWEYYSSLMYLRNAKMIEYNVIMPNISSVTIKNICRKERISGVFIITFI